MSLASIVEDLKGDPVRFVKWLWPDVKLYREQRAIMYSVWHNLETVVPAGHMLGKDFVTALVVLVFFLTRHPCRVLTTSVDGKQLEGVLWGEMKRFLATSAYPLKAEKGGPLVVNHLHIRKMVGGEVDGLSYIMGRVAAKGEGLSGHHIAQTGDGVPRTMFVSDEASGVDNESSDKASEWAQRFLIIGNPYECENRFKWAVKGRKGTDDAGGDIPRPVDTAHGEEPGQRGYLRKIIRIKGVDSPNVRYAMTEIGQGLQPSYRIIVPGVLPYHEYLHRLATWDKVKICVGLNAEFYEGAEVLMFPPAWLDRAEFLARGLKGVKRQAKAIGIDPAEGGDRTAMAAVDEYGLIELVSEKTPDTAKIVTSALAFMRKHGLIDKPEMVLFDRGGGGLEHAHRLREMGYEVRSLGFGEAVALRPKRGLRLISERIEAMEEQYSYVNRRAQMYGTLRVLLDPAGAGETEDESARSTVGTAGSTAGGLGSTNGASSDSNQRGEDGLKPRERAKLRDTGFALPPEYFELRRQLAPIPLTYDGEGRMYVLPKDKKDKKATQKTLKELIGCSPDEADALVLAIHCMLFEDSRPEAGAAR